MNGAVCIACGSAAPLRFEIHDRNRHVSEVRFPYYQCTACGLLFTWPVPPSLGDYYRGDYYGGDPSRERLARAARLEQYKIGIVQQFAKGNELLEIGASYGAFALLAKRAGFNVHAMELDRDCCRFLDDVVAVRAICTADPAAELERSDKRYDVIAMWHNLEHVPAPHAVFAAAASRLAPRGILVIATPNPHSLQFRILGPRWTHVDAPRHLTLISIDLLTRWATEAGLQTELITLTDRGSLEWNEFGWRETFAAASRNRFVRLGLRIVGSFVALVMMPFERSGRRGATYTAVFRRAA